MGVPRPGRTFTGVRSSPSPNLSPWLRCTASSEKPAKDNGSLPLYIFKIQSSAPWEFESLFKFPGYIRLGPWGSEPHFRKTFTGAPCLLTRVEFGPLVGGMTLRAIPLGRVSVRIYTSANLCIKYTGACVSEWSEVVLGASARGESSLEMCAPSWAFWRFMGPPWAFL